MYILALPGFAIVLELLPVFARKPLWGYRLAVSGMLGVSLLSWFVWQHHLFVSGINGDLRPFYMLSTEMISIPTGFTFLCGMMTLWRGHIRFTVPMLFCLAWFFNFLIGGLSGVFLSDVPSDVTTHGSFFVMAHFHYTIMGGLVFTFFAAIYYWVPKMTGWELNERLGKIHFWTMFIFFNSAFGVLFAVGFLGQARRAVTHPSNLQFLNDWVSVSAARPTVAPDVAAIPAVRPSCRRRHAVALAHVPPQRRRSQAPVDRTRRADRDGRPRHVPQLYDAAAGNEWIHVLEHVCFVAPALVFWGALLDVPPVRTRIDDLGRSLCFAAAMVPMWILAIVLAFAPTAIYAAYPSMTDQQLAAGVMWVPGSFTYFVAAFFFFYRWLEPGPAEEPKAVEPRPEELSWT